MNPESHLDKIKKLLRLSKSPNPNEAEAALAKAMELAMRHAVDIECLRDDPDYTEIMHKWFPMKARLSREWQKALAIAEGYFHVKPCICRRSRMVVLVGRADAIEVADYVISFLVRTCRACLKTFTAGELKQRRRMTSGKRAGFITGFFWGVIDRLEKGVFDLMREDSELALVLKNEETRREAVLRGLVGETVKVQHKPVRRSAATFAGFVHGSKVEINRPLAGPETSQGMLALN